MIDTIRNFSIARKKMASIVSQPWVIPVLSTQYSVLSEVSARPKDRSNLRIGLVLTAICLFCSTALAQPDAAPAEWLQDAELTAVMFINADRGWAVGDRGVIWHTGDGGRTWKLQSSGVTCRLEAIQFIDAENGFAVGGWTQPYTHQTHGVALRTRDGGKTWQSSPELTLPALKHVRFFDVRQGWALGDCSALYPAGVFRSEDGGRTWSPVPKGAGNDWITGDFRDGRTGAVAGLDGALGLTTATEIRPTRTPNLGPRYLQRMLLAGPTGGWLVGDGGLVLTTADSGFTWTAPAGPLPDFAGRELDFRALAVAGNHVWIAGAPGTCVVHSGDGGQTWQAYRTEQTAPLRGLWFIDAHRGWAVGALGTILHTRDGGQTWRTLRSGGTRVALLGVFSDPSRVPLELVAEQSGNDAFLTAVEIIGRGDDSAAGRRAELTSSQRLHEAMVATGGSVADSAWRFPLPESGIVPTSEAILARWNRANDGQAIARLEEHLVRRIRQWRPEVVVTEEVSPRGDNALAHVTNQITLAAVEKAADATAYSEQITQAGLAAWRVKKVLTVLPPEKQGVINVTPSQWASRLGRSPAEQAEAGRSLLAADVTPAPRNIGLAVLVDRLPQESGRRGVMSGIALQPGGEARRQLSDPPAGNIQALADVAQKRHNVEQLLARISTDATVGSGWLAQASDLTQGLPKRTAGEILWQLGRKYQQTGKTREAAEALQLLIEKHPQHPLADAAALWLVQYYASGEVAWRERKETKFEVRLATAVNKHEEALAASRSGLAAKNAPAVAQASFASIGTTQTAAPEMNPAERAARALGLAKQIEQTRPTVYANPALRFAVAAAARQAGQPRTADRFFQSLTASGVQSVWAQSAAAEQWLFRPNENPPKKACSVITALHKPRLDGRLDDAVWQAAKAVSLKSAAGDDADFPAAAVLACDEEFLYVGISCRKAPGVDYTEKDAPRMADADVAGRDRVMIMLDIDRDYASFWQLTIDHRGWPAESCFGDTTWNPQWFIAAAGDDQYWTAEAAIPLTELTPKKPQARDVWTIGLQRIIPRVGLQSFTTPAAVQPRPEGFGLMVFE